MKRGTERDLMRLLHGELPAEEAGELRARLRSEPELAEAYGRLERTWQTLALPPAAPVPPGFAGRVMARVRAQPAVGSFAWSAAPGWVRTAAAAALLAGAVLGVGVVRALPPPPAPQVEVAVVPASESFAAEEDYSLAEGYWHLVEDATAAEAKEGRP